MDGGIEDRQLVGTWIEMELVADEGQRISGRSGGVRTLSELPFAPAEAVERGHFTFRRIGESTIDVLDHVSANNGIAQEL